MRAVAAVGHQACLAIATDLAGDDAELQLAAIVVVLALDRLDRHDDSGEASVGIHRLEAGRYPGVRPQMEGAVDIVAVIFLQARTQITRGEGLAGAPDGFYADRFVDGV